MHLYSELEYKMQVRLYDASSLLASIQADKFASLPYVKELRGMPPDLPSYLP